MSDVTFRTPKAEAPPEAKVVEGKGEVVVSEHKEVEEPIVHYEELKGKPYAADFFELSGIWDDPDIEYAGDLREIDKAYKMKVQGNEIKDGKETYRKFIKDLQKEVGVTDDSPTSVRVAKIAEYVRFLNRIEEIDRNKTKYGNN